VYVALTRAREQIIIPWFEGNDALKDHSMLSYIAPLFIKDAKFTYQDVSVEYQADLLENQKETAITTTTRCILKLDREAMPEVMDAMVSPSVHEEHEPNIPTVTNASYASACDLSGLDKRYYAGEIGTWVHRLYQVLLLKPEHLALAMQMPPVCVEDEVLSSSLQAQLVAFKQYLEKHYQPIGYECECPVLSINEQNQIVSGTIDLLLETANGFWIIDHKTDKVKDDQKHYPQLLAYAKALRLEKPLLGMMINWTRLGEVTIYPA
jgi:ATP-dependent exoDNAse (exonuclease V) beta subunit